MIRRVLLLATLLFFSLIGNVALAEPTSAPVKILEIRPYVNKTAPGAVYIQVDQTSICNTNFFAIDLSFTDSKALLAVALSALLADKPVRIEVVSTGCAGWGTTIQSIYLEKQ